MCVPWHKVLLKQPGAVPAGAGVSGSLVEFAPLVWHFAHSGALLIAVNVWFDTAALGPFHGFAGCGAVVWHFLHDGAIPIGLL
jgi:hypothetical protein